MAVSVKIPTQLREATGGESTAEVDGSTVGEVLDSLYERYGELRSRIAEDGGLRRFVNVYVGGEDIRFLDGLDTAGRGRRRSDDPAGGRRRLVQAGSRACAAPPAAHAPPAPGCMHPGEQPLTPVALPRARPGS